MKKVVLKVELTDDKSKKKAMKIVSGLSGVESIAMDIKEKKLTVTGEIDAVDIVGKLRKLCHTDIVSVGPAKEPEKKKEEPKKEAAATADKKKEEPKKDNNQQQLLNAQLMKQYYMQQQQYLQQQQQYYQQHQTPSTPMPTHYYARSVEEDPNACVIC